jgi:hypothetical protein
VAADDAIFPDMNILGGIIVLVIIILPGVG